MRPLHEDRLQPACEDGRRRDSRPPHIDCLADLSSANHFGVLRDAKPLHADEDAFVFTSQAGNPLDEERFVEKHWRPALRATGVRPRKFYATRHTFISLTLMAGVVKLKRLAIICGTSVDMIERHYSKWMDDDRPEELAALGGSAVTRSRIAVGA